MPDVLTLRIVTTDHPVDAAVAEARRPGFLPGVDVVALPAGLDVERVNALLAGPAPGEGAPVMALLDRPAEGIAGGDLGMVQRADPPDLAAPGGGLSVLLGERVVPYDPRAFVPAWAMTFLRLQRYGGRFRHVVAASGPSTDLRYAAVAARAATAALTVLGTPDQIFRMLGPRDAAGVPASRDLRIAVGGGGHRLLRVVDPATGVPLAELPLRADESR